MYNCSKRFRGQAPRSGLLRAFACLISLGVVGLSGSEVYGYGPPVTYDNSTGSVLVVDVYVGQYDSADVTVESEVGSVTILDVDEPTQTTGTADAAGESLTLTYDYGNVTFTGAGGATVVSAGRIETMYSFQFGAGARVTISGSMNFQDAGPYFASYGLTEVVPEPEVVGVDVGSDGVTATVTFAEVVASGSGSLTFDGVSFPVAGDGTTTATTTIYPTATSGQALTGGIIGGSLADGGGVNVPNWTGSFTNNSTVPAIGAPTATIDSAGGTVAVVYSQPVTGTGTVIVDGDSTDFTADAQSAIDVPLGTTIPQGATPTVTVDSDQLLGSAGQPVNPDGSPAIVDNQSDAGDPAGGDPDTLWEVPGTSGIEYITPPSVDPWVPPADTWETELSSLEWTVRNADSTDGNSSAPEVLSVWQEVDTATSDPGVGSSVWRLRYDGGDGLPIEAIDVEVKGSAGLQPVASYREYRFDRAGRTLELLSAITDSLSLHQGTWYRVRLVHERTRGLGSHWSPWHFTGWKRSTLDGSTESQIDGDYVLQVKPVDNQGEFPGLLLARWVGAAREDEIKVWVLYRIQDLGGDMTVAGTEIVSGMSSVTWQRLASVLPTGRALDVQIVWGEVGQALDDVPDAHRSTTQTVIFPDPGFGEIAGNATIEDLVNSIHAYNSANSLAITRLNSQFHKFGAISESTSESAAHLRYLRESSKARNAYLKEMRDSMVGDGTDYAGRDSDGDGVPDVDDDFPNDAAKSDYVPADQVDEDRDAVKDVGKEHLVPGVLGNGASDMSAEWQLTQGDQLVAISLPTGVLGGGSIDAQFHTKPQPGQAGYAALETLRTGCRSLLLFGSALGWCFSITQMVRQY